MMHTNLPHIFFYLLDFKNRHALEAIKRSVEWTGKFQFSLKTCFDTFHKNSLLFEVRCLKSAVECLRFRKCSIGTVN